MRNFHPWIVLAAALAAISGFVGYDLYAERARLTDESREQAGQLSQVVADGIIHELRAINRVLETARDDLPRLAGPNVGAGTAGAVLKAVAASIVGLESLEIVSREGRVLASSVASRVGRDLRADPRYASLKPRAGGRTISISPPYDGGNGRQSLSIARVRLDRNGRPDGLVLAVLDASHFEVVLQSVIHLPDMRAGLVDDSGTIVSRFPDPEGALGRRWNPALDRLLGERLASDQRSGVIEVENTGFLTRRLIAYRVIDLADLPTDRPFVAFVGRDLEAIYAPWWRDLARRVARIAVFAIFASAGLVLLQRRRRVQEQLEATLAAERDAADRSFRKNAERMRLAFDSAHLGLWHWNLRDERLEVSAHALAHLGLPDGATMTYEKCLLAVHAEDRERIARAVAWSIDTRVDFQADYRVVWPDGTVRWLSATGRPYFGADGKPERMETVTQDITERKAVETELIASRAKLGERSRQVELLNVQLEARAVDAEAASRAKDAFLRNMSHELRTPLNHISGGAELLLMTGPTSEQRGWIRTVQAAARDLLRMVTEILEVARAQSGELTLSRVPFSPAAVADEVRLMLANRAETKGLHLRLDVDAAVPARLVGDPTRLAQGLLAYLDNAIKFTERGSVAIKVRAAAVDEVAATLKFEVRDTGIGIAPSAVGRIFKPFTQVDETLTRAYGGTGIGLTAVSEIAKRMGGAVGVESEPGAGSTFWFTAVFGLPDESRLAVEPAPLTPDGRAAAQDALGAIETRLADSDFRAYGLLVEHAQVLAAVLGQDYATLKQRVELFEFGEALAMARRLRQGLGEAAPRVT